MQKVTLGQNFAFGYTDVPVAERMRAIHLAGFDDVMIWWGMEHAATDGTPQALYDLAKRNGLNVRTAHFPSWETHHLWQDDEGGRQYLQNLLSAIRDCGAREIENLVLHTTRQLITPEPNLLGLERVEEALQLAEQQGVNLAFENTRFLRYNDYIYSRLSSPCLKFCFDSGHANCFTPGEDPLAQFGDRLCTMHLHDNLGAAYGDQHHLMGEGNIDWDALFARLKALSPGSYNLESGCHPGSQWYGKPMEDYLKASYDALVSHL